MSSMHLQVENTHCTAGQLIQGCVSWTPEKESKSICRLELELLGYEQVTSNETETVTEGNLHPVTRQRIEKEILVKFPYTLHSFAHKSDAPSNEEKDLEIEKEENELSYEYPFAWELPSSLPSSFHFTTTHQTFEIAYQITARAISTQGQVLFHETVPLHLQAARCIPPGQSVALTPRKVNILTNVVFPRGILHWGWSTPSDVVTTGSTIKITLQGENCSQVDLKDFVVRLMETIIWKSVGSDKIEHKTERTIADATLEVNGRREWLSGNPGAVMAPPTTVFLTIPDDNITCESYPSGNILRVEHSLVVIAQTATDRTTNPRLSHPVYLVRGHDAE
ncbi:hypothetical protein FisN_33Lh015 [Fistulifera solaris]|uniref:Arrestin C-terminal-like domain-containing protein n=1 Tax=Fistulifera solaris TaxID=1519565 RepID=A0A1Z5KA39_FISSO|nr:hypothetical protein FisN_33Lh015 [Fistulifera solaris]|eukprot:GAX23127.1 hypothetical protein FisN_33Lh015 [Fistulifera solaris]